MAIARDLTLRKTAYKGRPTQCRDAACPCRPCWNPHDWDHKGDMRCGTRERGGCPNLERTTAAHDFNRARRCRKCGLYMVGAELVDRENAARQASCDELNARELEKRDAHDA